jgi:hypothetical protein
MRRTTIGLCLAVGLLACTSTSTALRDPGHKDLTYAKVLVYANFKGLGARKEVETTVVAKLKGAHIAAASSLDYAIDVDAAAKKRVFDAGFDSVLEIQAGPNAAIVHTNVYATLHDIVDGSTVWQDQVEARSATNWTVQATVVDGAEMVADDLIKSKVLSNTPKPARIPSSTTI